VFINTIIPCVHFILYVSFTVHYSLSLQVFQQKCLAQNSRHFQDSIVFSNKLFYEIHMTFENVNYKFKNEI
jgi:hypothetical protein